MYPNVHRSTVYPHPPTPQKTGSKKYFKSQAENLAHFLIGSFIFLELSCRSCLYIFEISCLSVASFAIVFSHSEGCLFTLPEQPLGRGSALSRLGAELELRRSGIQLPCWGDPHVSERGTPESESSALRALRAPTGSTHS